MRLGVWILPILALLELTSIILAADWIGAGWTFLLIAADIVLGSLMLRHLGMSALLMAGSVIKSPRNVSIYQMLWPIRFVAAALLLVSPGFFSDLVAIGLMLPFKGKPLPDVTGNGYSPQYQSDDIIDAEYTVEPVPNTTETLPPNKE
ncbi:FxsA family protein [Stenoxybacter acetivorans]|uniref:FxsA family protein n=1 Tax=Stenoxybacter acetivorans TaxID=422441 RepID=UPI000569E09D|nr:FxsA family protein [Stenoxybacter acetivorans]